MKAYVYANGTVSETPRADMDDCFVVNSSSKAVDIIRLIQSHFGDTQQGRNVWTEVMELFLAGNGDWETIDYKAVVEARDGEILFRTPNGNLVLATMPELKLADVIRWRNGELIQNAMPYLTVEQRETMLSGIDQAMWNELFN